jgi:hypothetical protein
MKLRVRELDPKETCGPGTTAREVWIVTAEGQPVHEAHTVFWDRHGWYCGPMWPRLRGGCGGRM